MDKKLLLGKIEKYALISGFVCILAGIWVPVLNWVSIALFGLTYVTGFIKAYWKTGKVRPVSLALCLASLAWLALRQFTESPFLLLFGQVVLYLFLLDTQRTMLGHFNKTFLAYALCAVGVGLATAVYPCRVTSIANLLMQVWILFRFLDPILEQIGQAHRAKRLAALEQEKKESEVDAPCSSGQTTD